MGDPVYTRVATTFQDSFIYLGQDAARTPVTGKVQANFTIRLSKSGVGNQATTGITITEVDAVNNPGEYTLAVSSASGFVLAAGNYVLRIVDTASTQFSWTWDIFVTSDGTASGTIGPALFTPAINNGRITDGANPIIGAQIIIRTVSGALYYTSTSDSNGLYPAINFPSTTTTYTLYAIRSGYQQATATISVTAGVATGPGADVAMASAAVVNGFTASSLWAYARRSARNQTGTTADAEVAQIVTEAQERMATVRHWPWYRSYAELTLQAPYTTGTVTLTQNLAVVTLAGGTWPAWAVGAKFKVGGQYIKVIASDFAQSLTLEVAWAEATAVGQSFTLYQDEYLLPADMHRFGAVLPGQRWAVGPLPISPEALDAIQNGATFAMKFAAFYCIQKQSIFFSAYPSTTTTVRYTYFRRPATLNVGTDILDWDPAHITLIRRAIDCDVCVHFGSYVGGDYNQALKVFEEAVSRISVNDRTEKQEVGMLGSSTANLGPGRVPWQQLNR